MQRNEEEDVLPVEDVLLGGKMPTTLCRKSEKLEVLVKTWILFDARASLVLLLELVLVLLLLATVKTAAWTHDAPILHIRGPPTLVWEREKKVMKQISRHRLVSTKLWRSFCC